jgi:hypothetical protein
LGSSAFDGNSHHEVTKSPRFFDQKTSWLCVFVVNILIFPLITEEPLIVERASLDPIDQGLKLGWQHFGAALGHFALLDQLDQLAAGWVAGNYHRTVLRASHNVFVAGDIESLFGFLATMTLKAAARQDGQHIILEADRHSARRRGVSIAYLRGSR